MRSGWPSWPSGECCGRRWCRRRGSGGLRDLCRYRRTLIQERTREKQRVEKLLEDTQIKLSAVISDIFGKRPLHWGFVQYLLVVKDKEERRELEELAAQKGWTPLELNAEIRRRRPERKTKGGRPLRRHDSDGEALLCLVDEAQLWLRRCEMIQCVPKRLRPADRQKAIDVLNRVAKDARRVIAQLQELDRSNARCPRSRK